MSGRRRAARPPTRPRETELADNGAHTIIAHRQEAWSGPLPPPAALRAFEEIAPGSAQAIMAEFQAEAKHRRTLEREQNRFVAVETHVGQAIGLIFGLAALGVAGYAAYVGAQWIGSIVGGGVIASGIWALRRRAGK